MGGSVSSGFVAAIADLAILSTTISVDLELAHGEYHDDIYCAAFKAPFSGGDSFNWGSVHTVSVNRPSHWELSQYKVYAMPDITVDSTGAAIEPDTEYKVRCGVRYHSSGPDGNSFLSTVVKTPAVPVMCETGVKVNGVDAPKVLMAGQDKLTLSGLEWSSFHPAMLGMHAYEVPTPVTAMSTIEMKCCGGEECEFFFALYNCVACTGPKPAGLAETLLLDGWDAGACSPQFGDGFKTTAFHKSVHAVDGEIVMTFTAGHDEIMAMFGLEGSIVTPWCVKPHGPSAPGAGCGVRCPEL